MKSFLTGLVVLIILAFGFLYLTDNNSPQTPDTSTSTPETTQPNQTQPEETEVTIPSDFRLQAEPQQQYRIGIPYTVDVSSPRDNVTRYRYVGPNNQPNTEITDGYTITIEAQSTDVDSLEALLETRFDSTTALLSESSRETINGYEFLRYQTESALGNKPTTNYVVLPDNGYGYFVSINLSPVGNEEYEATTERIIRTIQFINEDSIESWQARTIPIAMLDYEPVGEEFVRESTGKERGCDSVVLIEHVLDEATSMPLTASLEQLFAYDQNTIGGWQNFIASQNDSLNFERVEITNGTARIYLSGELGSLGGVCDNPRAAIQIEETALAYETVNSVEIYLNNNRTSLIPSGRGEF